MGATYQQRGKHSWRVCVHYGRQRERTTVYSEQDAKDLVKLMVYGGDGTDTLKGGTGNDSLYGGEGNDTFTSRSSPASMWSRPSGRRGKPGRLSRRRRRPPGRRSAWRCPSSSG